MILREIIIMDDLERLLSENLFSWICKTSIISRILKIILRELILADLAKKLAGIYFRFFAKKLQKLSSHEIKYLI